MPYETIQIPTHGEGFYPITDVVKKSMPMEANDSGVLFLFCGHTSCALVVSESYDPSAQADLERFMQHLAPRDLPFIEHTLEGEDDSPSHMKSALLQQHIALPVERGTLILGRWQGIFLAEFRDSPHRRKVLVKFLREN